MYTFNHMCELPLFFLFHPKVSLSFFSLFFIKHFLLAFCKVRDNSALVDCKIHTEEGAKKTQGKK